MVRREKTDNNLVIAFKHTKRLSILNRDIVKKELDKSLRNSYKSTVLDLGGVEFIDSSVFRVILEYERRAELKGRKFYLSNVSQDVAELIHLLHLENVLEYEYAA